MTAQLLLERSFERSTQALLQTLIAQAPRDLVQIWLFEDRVVRKALEAQLAAHGMTARVRSAYKPLVHFFLEEVEHQGLERVSVRYPVHPAGHPQRFRLEAYPLAALIPGVALHFEALPAGEALWHEVTLHYADRTQTQRILAPNEMVTDFLGERVLRPSAWLLLCEDEHEMHRPLPCEYLQCYDAVLHAVTRHAWGQSEPYFEALRIEATLPGIEQPLPVGDECLSTTEALHEDLYFSLLEFFQQHSGRPHGNRGLQPGQIIPDIRLCHGDATQVRVSFTPRTPLAEGPELAAPATAADRTDPLAALTTQDVPLTADQVYTALRPFGGEPFAFTSRQGRPVAGIHQRGSRPAVLISGAQHANETTGVVGALRAADALRHDAGAHFVLMPLENPDGYALHQQLRQHNPHHMLHAARYSALGDDIEYRERPPWFERRARNHAFRVSGAQLHLNLHGYPAHEWTRPCTGYLPRGFELWSLPKGFFLILRFRPGHEDKARALLEQVTLELSQHAALAALNERQIALYRQHADALPFELLHGVPYLATEVAQQACNVTLITEFPDETITGDSFVLGHTAQKLTVLAATRWWWAQPMRHL